LGYPDSRRAPPTVKECVLSGSASALWVVGMSPGLGDHGGASASSWREIECLGSWEEGSSRSVVSASFGEVGLGCSEQLLLVAMGVTIGSR
jgi:hypothetical protein